MTEEIQNWLKDYDEVMGRVRKTFFGAEAYSSAIRDLVERANEIFRTGYHIKWADLPSVSVTYGTVTCKGCSKTRGSGDILNGVICECGYTPE